MTSITENIIDTITTHQDTLDGSFVKITLGTTGSTPHIAVVNTVTPGKYIPSVSVTFLGDSPHCGQDLDISGDIFNNLINSNVNKFSLI